MHATLQTDDTRAALRRGRRRRWSRRRTIVVWTSVVLGLLLLAIVGVGAWLAPKVLSVKDDLDAARGAMTQLKGSTDVSAIGGAVDVIAAKTAHAAQTADDPVWHAAEKVPFVGDNLRAVRVVSDTLDSLANQVGKPLLEVQSGGDGQLLARALPLIERASDEMLSSSDELTALASSSDLVGPVRAGVDEVVDALGVIRPLFTTIPPLLGADREMRYLLVFQNNAEALPLGGSAASQTLVVAKAGDVQVTDQGDSTKFKNGVPVDVAVDPSALELYGSYLIDHVNTAVTRPDFPTAARILRAFWQRDIDPGPVDAVISVDPLALARILRATGPIQVGDVELTADNAVKVLLSDSYARWDPSKGLEQQEASDGFFAAAAKAVFERVASGSFDIQAMMSAVTESIDRGSIMAWSEDPALAAVIDGQRVAGVLPADNQVQTTVGVFFRDSSAAKIDYYMASQVAVRESCAADRHTFDVNAGLHLDLTREVARTLPDYVVGYRGLERGYHTQVVVYGPPGTIVAGASGEAHEARVVSTDVDDLGRPVAIVETVLFPGEQASVHVSFEGTGTFGPLGARVTPMVRPTTVTVEDACG